MPKLTWFAAAALGVTAVGGGLFASAVSQPEQARPAATASATPGDDDSLPILAETAGPCASGDEFRVERVVKFACPHFVPFGRHLLSSQYRR